MMSLTLTAYLGHVLLAFTAQSAHPGQFLARLELSPTLSRPPLSQLVNFALQGPSAPKQGNQHQKVCAILDSTVQQAHELTGQVLITASLANTVHKDPVWLSPVLQVIIKRKATNPHAYSVQLASSVWRVLPS
jgi:hypothetical protein